MAMIDIVRIKDCVHRQRESGSIDVETLHAMNKAIQGLQDIAHIFFDTPAYTDICDAWYTVLIAHGELDELLGFPDAERDVQDQDERTQHG